jgi:S-adenosylmethionine:diacylglycerol 3-amino-3-carboxypropyl transferase
MHPRSRTAPSPSGLPGKASLFRHKVRAPVSITLTREHHAKVRKNMRRLGLTRADLIGLLIEKHADTVKR